MITVQQLADRVNSGSVRPGMPEVVQQAIEVVDEYVRANVPGDSFVPDLVMDRALLDAANHLWQQRNPGGLINTAYGTDGEAIPIRVSRDPLDSVRPLLSQWTVPLGFA